MRPLLIGVLVIGLVGVSSGAIAESPSPEPPPWFGEQRVEMPEHGFAVTVPTRWVGLNPTDAVEEQWAEVEGSWGVEGVRNADDTDLSGPLFLMAGPGVEPAAQECSIARLPDELAAEIAAQTPEALAARLPAAMARREGVTDVDGARVLDLAAGPTPVVDYTVFDFMWFTSYYLVEWAGHRAVILSCTSLFDEPPDDRWLSVAETFEFLPVGA